MIYPKNLIESYAGINVVIDLDVDHDRTRGISEIFDNYTELSLSDPSNKLVRYFPVTYRTTAPDTPTDVSIRAEARQAGDMKLTDMPGFCNRHPSPDGGQMIYTRLEVDKLQKCTKGYYVNLPLLLPEYIIRRMLDGEYTDLRLNAPILMACIEHSPGNEPFSTITYARPDCDLKDCPTDTLTIILHKGNDWCPADLFKPF